MNASAELAPLIEIITTTVRRVNVGQHSSSRNIRPPRFSFRRTAILSGIAQALKSGGRIFFHSIHSYPSFFLEYLLHLFINCFTKTLDPNGLIGGGI